MRKLLVFLLLLIGVAALSLWRGRDFAMLVDRFHVTETISRSIKTIAYEGSGTGGVLHVEDLALSLNEAELAGVEPSIGTTKDNQLALSLKGKVFPFGAISGTDSLAATVPAEDNATITSAHSALSWPNFFEVNFMTGNSPKWKRNVYQAIRWKKPSGEKLEMVWRYEQFFYAPRPLG
jgi:hypothetical protein